MSGETTASFLGSARSPTVAVRWRILALIGRDYTHHATVWKWKNLMLGDLDQVEWFDYEAFARPVGSIVGDPKVFRSEDGTVCVLVDGNGKVSTSVETEIEKMTIVYSG
ncbi:hypothetical protein V8E51_002909 [Hyaloscypha variabilis]